MSSVWRLASGVLLAASCWGEDGKPNPVVEFGSDTVSDLGGYVVAPLHWTGKEWAVATGVGVGIAAVALTADQHVKETAQNNRSDNRDKAAKPLNLLGTGVSVAYLGAAWGVGAAVGDPRGRELARDGLEASIIASGVITPALKLTAGRSRPSDVETDHWQLFSHNASFPSGHTTQAFTLAAVTARTFDDQPWVGALSFTVASGVAWARIEGNHHYLSDTMAGAAIGTTVGWFVVGRNRERRETEAGVKPVVAADRCGVEWVF